MTILTENNVHFLIMTKKRKKLFPTFVQTLILNMTFFCTVTCYFLFWRIILPLCKSKVLYKFGFLEGIFWDFQKKPNLQRYNNHFCSQLNCRAEKQSWKTIFFCWNLFFQPQNWPPSLGSLFWPWRPRKTLIRSFGFFLVFQLRKCWSTIGYYSNMGQAPLCFF